MRRGANITQVFTPVQLIDAALAGAVHIVVRKHLDMTTVTHADSSDATSAAWGDPAHVRSKALPYLQPSTLSITVRAQTVAGSACGHDHIAERHRLDLLQLLHVLPACESGHAAA